MASAATFVCLGVSTLTLAIFTGMWIARRSAWRLALSDGLVRVYLAGVVCLSLLWLALTAFSGLAAHLAQRRLSDVQRMDSILAWILATWFHVLMFTLSRALSGERALP